MLYARTCKTYTKVKLTMEEEEVKATVPFKWFYLSFTAR